MGRSWAGRGRDIRRPESLSVNPTDGSCWVANSTSVIHLGPDGTTLWGSPAYEFTFVESVSVNPADGSCWVADENIPNLPSGGASRLERHGVMAIGQQPVRESIVGFGECRGWFLLGRRRGQPTGGAPILGRGDLVAVGERRFLRVVPLGEPHGRVLLGK